MRRIDDPEDPSLADYRLLTDAAARRRIESQGSAAAGAAAAHGILIAEGPLAVRQLLASGLHVRSLLVTPERVHVADDLGPPLDVEVLVAPRAVLAEVAGYDVHRGVLASANRPPPADPAELVRTHERLVLVEAVNDNENIGSIFRNVAALGLGAVVLDDRCADPLYRRSVRVSSGWTLRVPHARVPSLGDLAPALRDRGVRAVALTPAGASTPVDRAAASGALDGPLALMVGAEGTGLDAGTLEMADLAVRVPMQAEVDSLNVATALAVVGAFSAARRAWGSA